MTKDEERKYNVTTYLLLFIVIAAMGIYQYLIGETKPKYDEKGEIVYQPTEDD